MDQELQRHELMQLSALTSVPLALYRGEACLYAFAPYPVSVDMVSPWVPLTEGREENPCYVLTEERLLFGRVINKFSGETVFAGPVRADRLREQDLERILSAGEPFLLEGDLREVTLYLNACEACSTEKFIRLLLLLYGMVNQEIRETLPDSPNREMHRELHRGGGAAAYDDRAAADYEKRILYYVQYGMPDQIRRMAAYPGSMPELAETAIRQQKNALIILNSLCQRAAISGGLEPEISHRIGAAYLRQIEGCRTTNELMRLNQNREIAVYYSEQVDRAVNPQSSNPHVRKAIRYIRRNIQKKLTAGELAEEVHLSKEYLSSCFHRETGMTLPAYIAGQKVLTAKELLTFTEMSIADIAAALSYSSQSYFQSVFRRLTGETPQSYRQRTR
ncbi:MAG: AraC family transcriptional regulator [Roseburia sp.]|nr:AraC family transcriptional regulator [Roseburia sp.]MCM1098458.1 AraC family transcriptional regulator [Ruminococcus flavefaciens]